MPENSTQKLSDFFDVLSKLAAVIAACVSVYLTLANRDIERKLKDLDTIKRVVEINQDSLLFDREFKFKIYQLAIEAIKSKDSIQQEAAYVAVSTMVADTLFKSGLLSLFVKSKTVLPEIRKAAAVAKFDIRESKDPTPVYSPTDKIHVDIIYLADVIHTRSVARKIYNALRSSDYYEVRVKPFTSARNEAVYKIEKNQIRYDVPEKAKAQKLMEIVNQILPMEEPRFIMQKTDDGKPTEGYISLFIVQEEDK